MINGNIYIKFLLILGTQRILVKYKGQSFEGIKEEPVCEIARLDPFPMSTSSFPKYG